MVTDDGLLLNYHAAPWVRPKITLRKLTRARHCNEGSLWLVNSNWLLVPVIWYHIIRISKKVRLVYSIHQMELSALQTLDRPLIMCQGIITEQNFRYQIGQILTFSWGNMSLSLICISILCAYALSVLGLWHEWRWQCCLRWYHSLDCQLCNSLHPDSFPYWPLWLDPDSEPALCWSRTDPRFLESSRVWLPLFSWSALVGSTVFSLCSGSILAENIP